MRFQREFICAAILLIATSSTDAHDLPGGKHSHAAPGSGMTNQVKIEEVLKKILTGGGGAAPFIVQ